MTTPRLTIDYYTDPVCSWSWALEPQRRWLDWALGPQLRWRLRLGAMLTGAAFRDVLQDIERPAQWAPQWFEVARRTGMPLQPSIWHDDPPHESVSACLAVSAARLQGEPVAAAYLRRLREAVVLGRRNIARREALFELAVTVERLDVARLARDFEGAAAHDGLRADLMEGRYLQIARFPALVIGQARAASDAPRMLVVGWRPREALLDALRAGAPELVLRREAHEPVAFVEQCDTISTAELALMFELSREDARRILEQHAKQGRLELAADIAPEHELYRRAQRAVVEDAQGAA